jgi:uncharacterized surface protein with fasciclin (FAS1) repeats
MAETSRRGMLLGLAAAMAGAATTLTAVPAEAHARVGSIPEVARRAGQFETLLAAAAAAGLVPALSGRGPLTVFAPTDAAFAALAAGTVQSLLRPENRATLRRILSYHVVPGRVLARDLAGRRLNVRTLAGLRVHIDGRRGVRVNRSRVIRADVLARNGVIHVIDRVLMPPTH